MNPTHQARSDFLPAEKSLAFWLIFAPAFVVFFAVAVLAALLGAQWRTLLPGAENSKGLIEGVSSAVYTLMSFII